MFGLVLAIVCLLALVGGIVAYLCVCQESVFHEDAPKSYNDMTNPNQRRRY